LDADQAIYDVHTVESMMADRTAGRRFVLLLLTAFAGIALVLASVGLYGVIAFGTAQRRREFAIRIALGAAPSSLIRSVVSQGVRLAAAGIPLGIVLTLAGTRVLESLLFGVQLLDPASAAGAVALLTATALLAAWLPARRAARADPLQAMHGS
jgi:ABC-type antimicrobial peptide transport system permease subunit